MFILNTSSPASRTSYRTQSTRRNGSRNTLNGADELDRDWYGGQEDGIALGDDFHNPFGGSGASWAEQEEEVALAERKNNRRMNPHAIQRQRDSDTWETNRMLQSGGEPSTRIMMGGLYTS